MAQAEVLHGLPASGALPRPFPPDGASRFREGLVVRFCPRSGTPWIGNFERGLTSFDALLRSPASENHIVVAGGRVYIIDSEAGQLCEELADDVIFAAEIPPLQAIVFANDTAFWALRDGREWWRSDRVSWDGMRNFQVSDLIVSGEAFSPNSGGWHPFSVDAATGRVRDGIYSVEFSAARRIKPES